MFLKKIPFVYKYGLKIKHFFLLRRTIRKIGLYLENQGSKKIQLGAGQNHLSDWFNTDYFSRGEIFFLDVTKKIPIPSESFDFAFSEHHIEHIHYNEAQLMISETYRILKPGGVFRICTPDLNCYLKSYFEANAMDKPYVKEILNDWIKTGFHNAKNYIPQEGSENISFFINDIFLNYNHKFIYDEQTLKTLLTDAGFKTVHLSTPIKSDFIELNNIETHLGNSIPFTLAIEAVK